MVLSDLDRALHDRLRFLRYIGARPEERLACWPWEGPVVGKPGYRYGCMGLKVNGVSTKVYAHRLTVLFTDGEVADEGLVCHSCAHTLCVRRSHLYVGTAHQRAQDSYHRLWKLREDDVREILRRLAAGHSKNSLARAYGVSSKLIWNIAEGRTWRHITLVPGPWR